MRRSKKQQMQQRIKMAARKLLAEDKGERGNAECWSTHTEYKNEHKMTYLGVAWGRAAVVAVVGDITSPKPQQSSGLAKMGQLIQRVSKK